MVGWKDMRGTLSFQNITLSHFLPNIFFVFSLSKLGPISLSFSLLLDPTWTVPLLQITGTVHVQSEFYVEISYIVYDE